jgi:hypothetical protein
MRTRQFLNEACGVEPTQLLLMDVHGETSLLRNRPLPRMFVKMCLRITGPVFHDIFHDMFVY